FFSIEKQYKMLSAILKFKSQAECALESGVYLEKILELPIRDKIARLKYVPEKDINKIDDVVEDLEMDIKNLIEKEGVIGD
ncbi:V-type ATP synthase alpha chain, partial [Candidatus Arthromitus sp. SFB-4]